MKKAKFHEGARRDYLESLGFYLQHSLQAAQNFQEEYRGTRNRIGQFPGMGTPDEKGTRRFTFPSFPFSLIYLEEEEQLFLIAVAHHSRTQGYWKDRLKNGV